MSWVVLFALGCGGSSDTGSGGGCGSTAATGRCEIVAEGTACGDRITVECFDGATPEAKSQCEKALEQEDEAVYCCTSAVAEGEALTGSDGGEADGTSSSTVSSTGTTGSSSGSSTGAGGGGEGGGSRV